MITAEEMREWVEVLLIDLSHGGGVLIKGNTDAHAKLTELCNAYLATAPAEPRAAEGAGTVAELTAVIARDNGAAEADAAIASINEGGTVIQHNASEMFFHQLRYRVAKDPALCERIKVLYRDASGKLVPIGLRFEDELSWPPGFLQGSWDKEREIQLIRKPTAAAAVPAGGDAVAWRYWVSDTNHSVWHDMPVDQENRADCEELGYQVQYAYTAPAPRGRVTEAQIDTIRNGSLVFRNAAREYLAAVAHLFDSKAGKDGKFLAEMSPLDDQQCFEAFKNLNDTGARLRQCCDKLDGIVARQSTPPAAQAQDAGPKARHWREAISLQHGTAWLNAIEQEARALAAKEAK